MTYSNITPVTSTSVTFTGTYTLSYASLSLIGDIPHNAQISVERIFTTGNDGSATTVTDFLADPVITAVEKRNLFIVPTTRITFNEATKTITAVNLPTSGGAPSEYIVTANSRSIRVPPFSPGQMVMISRKTVSNVPLVTWTAGTKITASQLNTGTTQLLHTVQELVDYTRTRLVHTTDMSSELAAGSGDTDHLQDRAVTSPKIALNAVLLEHIPDGQLTNVKLADLTVTAAKIAANTITPAKINTDSTTWTFVGTAPNLTAGNTTTIPALTGAVTSSGLTTTIANNVITDTNISTSAAISDSKLAQITTANKVANSATSAVEASTPSTIVLRNSSGNIPGNITGSALTAATVTGAAQSNITSLGTLTGLSVSGTTTLGDTNLGQTAVTGNMTVSGNITAGTISGSSQTTLISTDKTFYLGASPCSFTGSITLTTLTLTTVISGTLSVGSLLSGGTINSATKVLQLLTGSMGANGSTYEVSISQTQGSTTITGTGNTTVNTDLGGIVLMGTVNRGMYFSNTNDAWEMDHNFKVNSGKNLRLGGATSGAINLAVPAVAGAGTVTLPLTGTLVTLAGSETLTNKTLTTPTMTGPTLGTVASGSTWNGQLIAGQYGGTGVNNNGKLLTLGGNFQTGHQLTLTTSAATNVTLPITGTLATLAGTETLTSKTIDNATLNSPTMVTPTLGTVASGSTWNGQVIAGLYGGTGVANSTKTITLGGNLITSGAFSTTLVSTGATSVTLPLTGTLATRDGDETFTNKTLGTSGSPADGRIDGCTNLPIDAGTVGVLPSTRGGTAQSTYTLGDILYSSAANTLSTLPAGTSGQVLSISAEGIPDWVTLSSGGAGVAITCSTLTASEVGTIQGVTVGRGFGTYASPPADNNTVLGRIALVSTSSSQHTNTAIGADTLSSTLLTGYRNTAVGASAGADIQSGNHNTCVGYGSGCYILGGSNHIAIGALALKNTTGSNSIAIGTESGGTNTAGSYCIYLGTNTASSGSNVDNEIVIGSHPSAANVTGFGQNTTRIGTPATILTKIGGAITSLAAPATMAYAGTLAPVWTSNVLVVTTTGSSGALTVVTPPAGFLLHGGMATIVCSGTSDLVFNASGSANGSFQDGGQIGTYKYRDFYYLPSTNKWCMSAGT